MDHLWVVILFVTSLRHDMVQERGKTKNTPSRWDDSTRHSYQKSRDDNDLMRKKDNRISHGKHGRLLLKQRQHV